MSQTFNSITFLRKVKINCEEYILKGIVDYNKGNSFDLFNEQVILLQGESSSKGCNDEALNKIFEILKLDNLNVKKRISLAHCLIPEKHIPEDLINDIIEWIIEGIDNKIPATLSSVIIKWINGIWDYELVNKRHIAIYYDCFFSLLMTSKNISSLSRLIYSITKPENVSRRNVMRILRLQLSYKPKTADWKKCNAILLLFKTYKPECVPENIEAMNFQTIWNTLPVDLEESFEAARKRIDSSANAQEQELNMFQVNINVPKAKGKKHAPLIPLLNYLHYDMKRFTDVDTVSIFELNSVAELGKHFSKINLPNQAVSLLSNLAGYHLLAFSDASYQNRFMYNLYNTLNIAFFTEEERFPDEERKNLLRKTIQFCQYLQEGLPAVNYFLNNYLSLRNGDDSKEILELLSWSFDTPKEMQDNLFQMIKLMYDESTLKKKCEIMKMLSNMVFNKYVSRCFNYDLLLQRTIFLKQKHNENPTPSILAMTEVAEDLSVSGLLTHAFDSKLLYEVLNFYMQLAILQSKSTLGVWTIAPPTVIYGAFTRGNLFFVSTVCKLLTEYHEQYVFISSKGLQDIYKNEIKLLFSYFHDFIDILLEDKAFECESEDRSFLKTFPKSIIRELNGHRFNKLLSLANHLAFLPHCLTTLSTMSSENLPKNVDNSVALLVATHYYHDVSELIERIQTALNIRN